MDPSAATRRHGGRQITRSSTQVDHRSSTRMIFAPSYAAVSGIFTVYSRGDDNTAQQRCADSVEDERNIADETGRGIGLMSPSPIRSFVELSLSYNLIVIGNHAARWSSPGFRGGTTTPAAAAPHARTARWWCRYTAADEGARQHPAP